MARLPSGRLHSFDNRPRYHPAPVRRRTKPVVFSDQEMRRVAQDLADMEAGRPTAKERRAYLMENIRLESEEMMRLENEEPDDTPV